MLLCNIFLNVLVILNNRNSAKIKPLISLSDPFLRWFLTL